MMIKKIKFAGGFFGRPKYAYIAREIFKQLVKLGYKMQLDGQKVQGYWEKYYEDLGKEDLYILNGHANLIPKLIDQHKKIISICSPFEYFGSEMADILNLPEVKQVWTTSKLCKTFLIGPL